MNKSVNFKYDAVESLMCEADGHYHIQVPMFYEYKSYSNDKVDFIFDTGAYITVLTRQTYTSFGFVGVPTIATNVELFGFVGGCKGDIKEIPGFVLSGHRLESVRVAVPYVNTKMNILGLNVLELFKYLIDTENSLIYFAENPRPNISEQLHCGKMHIVSDAEEGVVNKERFLFGQKE